jgi:hypothetical protein
MDELSIMPINVFSNLVWEIATNYCLVESRRHGSAEQQNGKDDRTVSRPYPYPECGCQDQRDRDNAIESDKWRDAIVATNVLDDERVKDAPKPADTRKQDAHQAQSGACTDANVSLTS